MAEYADRRAAGRVLAEVVAGALAGRGDEAVLVLGLPRGGVPVAAEVAHRLGAPLDALGVRKLGAPGQPEYAVGAIAVGGARVVNEITARRLGLSEDVLAGIVARESAELARRERAYRDERPLPALAGRTVVLVDDGLATGATMVAAVRAARQAGARMIVAAAPVGSPEAAAVVRAEADVVLCPLLPPGFLAVGQYYAEFAAPADDEVRGLLRAGAGAAARRRS